MNNTKFKYLMGIWKILPEYPTEDDIIYEIKEFLKGNNSSDIFDENTLSKIFGKDYKEEKFQNSWGLCLKNNLIEKIEISNKLKYKLNSGE